jgi:hypothetical protein
MSPMSVDPAFGFVSLFHLLLEEIGATALEGDQCLMVDMSQAVCVLAQISLHSTVPRCR